MKESTNKNKLTLPEILKTVEELSLPGLWVVQNFVNKEIKAREEESTKQLLASIESLKND